MCMMMIINTRVCRRKLKFWKLYIGWWWRYTIRMKLNTKKYHTRSSVSKIHVYLCIMFHVKWKAQFSKWNSPYSSNSIPSTQFHRYISFLEHSKIAFASSSHLQYKMVVKIFTWFRLTRYACITMNKVIFDIFHRTSETNASDSDLIKWLIIIMTEILIPCIVNVCESVKKRH